MKYARVGKQVMSIAQSIQVAVIPICLFIFTSLASAQWREAVSPYRFEYIADSKGEAIEGAMALLSAEGTTVTTNETEATPEINMLARALDYDPKLIFEYVRNHIEYNSPIYGVRNGAHGCLMAGRGNDWDQAALLTSLFRVSGYTTRFKYGLVKYTRADLGEWFGIPADAVIYYVSDGGNPGGTNDNTHYFMARVWVEAQIDGVWYSFDPAFKSYRDYQRPDIQSAMGYTKSAFVYKAGVGASVTTDYAMNVNEAKIRTALKKYTTNLVQFIQTNNPLMTVCELVGGRQMVFENLTTFPTNIPKAVSFYATPVTWDHIPASSNVTLTVKYAGINKTFKGYEIACKRLSLYYDSTQGYRPQLRLDGEIVATGNTTSIGAVSNIEVTVNHPYLGTYCDSTKNIKVISGNRYVIIHDFEGISPAVISSANKKLSQDIALGLDSSVESVFAGSMDVTVLSGLQQWYLSVQLLGQLSDVKGYFHHFVGIMGQQSGYYVDIPEVVLSSTSKTQDLGDERAWFKACTLFVSALEHGLLEQTQGSNSQAVSTIKLLQLNNANGNKTFLATSANWASVVKPALFNYSAAKKTEIEADITIGRKFVLPENGGITLQQWTGYGYVNYSTTNIGMLISGDYNGGHNGTPGSLNIDLVVKMIRQGNNDLLKGNISYTTSYDPVDLHSGNFLDESVDITLGTGSEPSGLAFSRSYTSGENFRKFPMGYGWTHSYDIDATETSLAGPSFGLRRPEEVTPFIVQSIVTFDLMQSTPDVLDWMSAILATKWGMDQLIDNCAVVKFGMKSMEFIKLPDDTYVSPFGVTATLTKQGGAFVLNERFGKTYNFNPDGSLSTRTDADGNSIAFSYNSTTNLAMVSNNFGRVMTLAYNGSGCVKKINDQEGRSVSYTYYDNNLISVLDVESNEWTMSYDGQRRLIAKYDPLSRLIVSNKYDSVSKVKTQMNGASNVWSFFISGWRGVDQDPEGARTIHFFDDEGRNLGTQDAVSNRTYNFYDSQGHLVSNIDARGYATFLQYDNNHNVTNQINSLGHSTAYSYDNQYRLATVTDPLGHVTRYYYDSENHVTNIVDSLTNRSAMTYTAKGLLKNVTDGNGIRSTSFTYDSFGNPLTVNRTDGGIVSNAYDAVGNLSESTDANGKKSLFGWNKRRLLTSDKDAAGFTVSNVYNALGQLTRIIDRQGYTNKTTYTATGKPSRITLADGGIILNTYDSLDRLSTVTDPLGRVSSNRYDKAGRKIGVVDALGNESSFAFDPNGNMVAQTNSLGKVTTFVFDELNRLIRSVDSLNHTNTFEYDAKGRQIAVADAEGLRTEYQFDALDRQSCKIKPDGVTESFEYDTLGNLIAFVNGAGNRMTFGYDGMGRLLASTNAVGSVTTYDYDDFGNRLSRHDANGATTLYRYDSVNNLTNIAYPSGLSVRFKYNANRLPTNMIDITGSTAWRYDRMNRLTNVVVSGSGSPTRQVSYAYDLAGNRTSVTFADAKNVSYRYDSLNRLTNVVDCASRTTAFAYDSLGRETGILYPNAVSGALEWDDADRLTRICYSIGGSNFIDRAFTLNPAGDISAMDVASGVMPQLPPAVRRFSQNSADELTQIAQKAVPDAPAETVNPFYGDLNGNLTNAAGLLLAYDADNRITNMVSGAMTTAITYDGLGNRVKVGSSSGGQTNITWFVLDYADPLCRPLAELDSAGQPVRWFVWGKGLVSQVESNGALHYAHGDSQGSTLAFTDNVGTPTDQWFYSPYGSVLNRTGATETPFQWLGGHGVRCQDDGMYLTLYRMYNSELMRFTSADPIGLSGGANLYAYCAGNPLTLMDPEGKCGNENRIEFFNQGYGPNQSYQIVGANERNLTKNDWQAVGPYYMGAGLSMGFMAASTLPGVGQAMDLATLNDPSAGTLWKALAFASLAIDSRFGGLAPNVSSLRYAAKSELFTVRTYTGAAGREGITSSRVLNADTWVTLPGEIPSRAGHLQIEKLLEIEPGRGANFLEFQVPSSNLRVPVNGPTVPGSGAWQRQLIEPVPVDPSTFRRPPGRPGGG
ncbi:MAG: RHS repeat-associated core domain-containing protein [Kiritimatiellia bacterium]